MVGLLSLCQRCSFFAGRELPPHLTLDLTLSFSRPDFVFFRKPHRLHTGPATNILLTNILRAGILRTELNAFLLAPQSHH